MPFIRFVEARALDGPGQVLIGGGGKRLVEARRVFDPVSEGTLGEQRAETLRLWSPCYQ